MKAKPTTIKKEEPLNDILGVNIGMPSLSETGFAVQTAENIISAYENEAREILRAQGYPLTLDELCKARDKVLPDLSNGRGLSQVYSIFWMLWFLNDVRAQLQKNNADHAVCSMAIAVHWAIRARLKPVVPKINMGVAFTDGRDKGLADKVKRQKKIREALAKTLVMKYPRLNAGQLVALKVPDKNTPKVFECGGLQYKVYWIIKKGPKGVENTSICFESLKESFDYAMDTFLNTLQEVKKLQ